MKRYLLPIAAILLLSACTSQPQQTLDQKLEGKTVEEKQEILRLACLNEADYTTNIKKSKYRRQYGSKRVNNVQPTDETTRLKTLCREMNDAGKE